MLVSARTVKAAAMVIVVVTVGLTGCQDAGAVVVADPGPPIPSVETVALDVPPDMLPVASEVMVRGDVVPGGAGLPALVGGSIAGPGERARPAVWSSEDGATWEKRDVVDEFAGSFTGVLAGSSMLSALAGVSWLDGTWTSHLWTSTDRSSWAELALPEAFTGAHSVDSIEVSGDAVFGIGTDVEGAAMGFVVGPDAAEAFDLPTPAEGEVLGAVSLAVHEDVLLLLARPGSDGEPEAFVTFRSEDRGETWGAAVDLAPKTALVTGLVWTESGFVATGALQGRTALRHALRPAAWFSAAGHVWAPEVVPEPADDSPFGYSVGTDVWLGAPQAGAGVVTSVAAHDRSVRSAVHERAADGTWTLSGLTTPNAAPGKGGRAVRLEDGTTLGVLSGAGAVRIGLLVGSEWTDRVTLADREDVFETVDLVAREGGLSAHLRREVFVTAGEGWHTTLEIRRADIETELVREVPWDPAPIADLVETVQAEDAGSEVILGTFFDIDTFELLVEGWTRPSGDAAWVPVIGFPADGSTHLRAVTRTTTGWTAVGSSTTRVQDASTERATVWSSHDGVSWVEETGDLGKGSLARGLNDVCSTAGGELVAVGWVEDRPRVVVPAAWTRVADRWERTDVGERASAPGSAYDCSTSADAVVITAKTAERDAIFRTVDGTAWEEVFVAGRGSAIGHPVEAPGGFVASGSWTDGVHSYPVVWVSRDGATWSPVAVSSVRSGRTSVVAVDGAGLVVTMDPVSGHPISRIEDIATVIAEHAG